VSRACLSRLELAQYRTGVLNAERQREIEEHLDSCASCAAAHEQLESNEARYLHDLPRHTSRLRDAIDQQAVKRLEPRAWRRWLPVALGALAAAGLVLLLRGGSLFGPAEHPVEQAAVPYTGYRGSVALRVVARRAEQQFIVSGQRKIRANDRLRFIVTTDSPGYLTLFSVDGTGRAAPFYPPTAPETDGSLYRVRRAGRQVLPDSIVVDEAPGPERLVVFFSERRFDRAAIHRVLARELRQSGTVSRATVSRIDPRATVALFIAEKEPTAAHSGDAS
jgi:hypothetical protein